MYVVKIGGSLLQQAELKDWLKVLLENRSKQCVIVPGGACFAELVRHQQQQWHFSDEIAHRMAIRSMDQYGLLLSDTSTDFQVFSQLQSIKSLFATEKIPVWLPSACLDENQDIPQNWSVTSDSLAAWLSNKLTAEKLLLIKSVAPKNTVLPVEQLIKEEIVDPAFDQFITDVAFSSYWYGKGQYKEFGQMLKTGTNYGCQIGDLS